MSVELIRVCDEATPEAELVEALGSLNARAKRIPHVLGTTEMPTEWDRRHAAMDELLTLMELER